MCLCTPHTYTYVCTYVRTYAVIYSYLHSYILAAVFNNLSSGNQSRLPITICATECTGKESRLSQCKLKSCKDSALYQLPCKKENIIGIQCSKFYTLVICYTCV